MAELTLWDKVPAFLLIMLILVSAVVLVAYILNDIGRGK